jgi:hypothetical protein
MTHARSLAELLCTVRDCETTEDARALQSHLGRSFDEQVPALFEDWLAIISPDSRQPDDLIKFALSTLSIALRAIQLPFFTAFPPDWFERLEGDQPIRLGLSLIEAILRDDHDIPAKAALCVPLFVAAAGDASAPLFARLHECLTDQSLPDLLRFRLLSTLEEVYQSGAIVKVTPSSQIEILCEHVNVFYFVLGENSLPMRPFWGQF